MTATPAAPFFSAVRKDMAELAKTKGTPYPSIGGYVDVLTLPGFWAVFLWRLANVLHGGGLRPLSRLIYFLNLVVFGADLPAGALVGAGLVMPHPVGVAFASDVVIGARCRVMGMARVGGGANPNNPGHPVIGNDVWLMDGCKVLGPVTIGDRTIVGAAAIVANDVAADMFVFGPRTAAVIRPLAELGLADHGGALHREEV